MVRRGAKLLHAFGECVVPRVTLVTRKTYGGAYIAMNARSLGATRVLAWPGAEVAVMGAVAAIRILHRRRLAEVSPEIRPQVEAELAAEHERIAGGVDKARRDRRRGRGGRAVAPPARPSPTRSTPRCSATASAAGSTATSPSDPVGAGRASQTRRVGADGPPTTRRVGADGRRTTVSPVASGPCGADSALIWRPIGADSAVI